MQGKVAIENGSSSSSTTITVTTPLMVELRQSGTVLESGKKQISKHMGELKLLAARVETSKSNDKDEYKAKCSSALMSLGGHEDDCNLYLAKILGAEDEDDEAKKALQEELKAKIVNKGY